MNRNWLAILVMAGAAATADAQITTPLEIKQDQAINNIHSQRGVPLSETVGTPAGSDGRAPSVAQQQAANLTINPASSGQFKGVVHFGAVGAPLAPAGLVTSRSLAANALTINLPRSPSVGTPVVVLLNARVAAPYVSRQVSFLFGAVIPPPETDENGAELAAGVDPETYWLPEPFSANDHEDAPYYWSPHARRVFATQSGPVDITWMRAVPFTVKPADFDADPSRYHEESGNYYPLYRNRYIVSSSPVQKPRKMFWTQGGFRDLGKTVSVPTARVGGIRFVYNQTFPERVAEEVKAIGHSSIVTSNALEELRTIWFDNTDNTIKSLNHEGRVFAEILGDAKEDGQTRVHLGFEIIDVRRQPIPADIVIELGEYITAYQDGRDDSNLKPDPIINFERSYLFRHVDVETGNARYVAERETFNLNDVLVHWLETGVAGLLWPERLGRYRQVWPNDVTKYSHYVRPVAATGEEAKLTGIVLPQSEVGTLAYQDTYGPARAYVLPTEQLFYSHLTHAQPVHRTLLRFESQDGVRFERVYSWLNDALVNQDLLTNTLATVLTAYDEDSRTFNFSDVLKSPRVVAETVDIGNRILPPSGELGNNANDAVLVGYIVQEKGNAFDPTAYIDPYGEGGFTNANQGAIIPVNAAPGNDLLEIHWFRANEVDLAAGFKPLYWPSAIGRYTIQWPESPSEIIMASNDGSGALPSLQAKGSIYYQNSSSLPGYNPNEEHALMLGGQAYALRDDLNLTDANNYSSAPYVLLRYTEADDRPAMRVFKVLRESKQITFDFDLTAPSIVQAPMPLPFMELPLPENVVDKAAVWNRQIAYSTVLSNTVPSTNDGGITITADAQNSLGPFWTYVLQEGSKQTNLLYFFSVDGIDADANQLSGVILSNRPVVVSLMDAENVSFDTNSVFNGVLISGDTNRLGDQVTQAKFELQSYHPVATNGTVWLADNRGALNRYELTVMSVATNNTGLQEVTVDFSGVADEIEGFASTETYTYEGPILPITKEYRRYDLTVLEGLTRLFVPMIGGIAADELAGRYIDTQPIPLGVERDQMSSRETLYAKSVIKDRKGSLWAYRGPHNTNDMSAEFQAQFYYKTLAGFYFPSLPEDDQPDVGSLAPYLRKWDSNKEEFVGPVVAASAADEAQLKPANVNYLVKWPDNPPILNVGESLMLPKRGLPAVRGNTSLEVLYEQSLAPKTGGTSTVTLHDPTREKQFKLVDDGGLNRIPSSANTFDTRGFTFFPNLPPHLENRFFFDANRGSQGALVFRGEFIDAVLGEDYLRLNVLSAADLDAMKGLVVDSDPDKPEWDSAIEGLSTSLERFAEDPSRPGTFIPVATQEFGPTDLTQVSDDDEAVDSYAISATGPGDGFVTLIAGNGRAFTPEEEPVALQVFKVASPLYRGEVKVAPSSNPLSELVTFEHTADLAGKAQEYEFEWRIAPPIDGQPPTVDTNADDPGAAWLPAREGTQTGLVRYVLGGVGIETLSDQYLITRYRPLNTNHTEYGSWSQWTSPQLAEGWIKRVLAGINPFNQRITDLFNNSVNTDVSLVAQAGRKWEGNVALNLENINDFGLIEIYETVLGRGRMLSIDAGINFGPANDALLLAAGYLNDLYMILGNEARADAANPTIGIDTHDSQFGDIATALFAFKGQVASSLEEELALLRGRDDFLVPGVEVTPVYNRLVWNYTRGIDAGEVIYALNYNIKEDSTDAPDGVINAADAAKLFPQGHGDAYGHYLTALKGYYSLLMNPDFDWVPRIEAVLVLGQPVSVDYLDERKFAAAAAATGNAGAEVFQLTWSKDYQSGRTNGWEHFGARRSNQNRLVATERHWGLDHWATRTGVGTYVNWVVGNSILPDEDPDPSHEGIQKVDRTTVVELAQLPIIAARLQTDLSNAENGLNPLGLPETSVPFDLAPSEIAGGEASHFEQILSRAKAALNNAVVAFNEAKDVTRLMRSEENSLDDLRNAIAAEELAFTNALIEIYGTPYPDDIGAGKTYPTGYLGPDLVHYSYVETPELSVPDLIEPEQEKVFELDIQSLPDWFVDGTADTFDFFKREGGEAGVDFIEFTLASHGFYDKPRAWNSRRVSPGQIQQAISEIIQARHHLLTKLEDAAGAKDGLVGALSMFDAKWETIKQINDKSHRIFIVDQTTRSIQGALDIAQAAFDAMEDTVVGFANATADSLPENFIAGFSNGGDLTSGAKGAIAVSKTLTTSALNVENLILSIASTANAFANETAIAILENEIGDLEQDQELREDVSELGGMLGDIQGAVFNINSSVQPLDDAERRLQSLIAKGNAIQAEREIARKRSSAIIQGFRTRDAAFRVFRNEKIERYRTLFDLAAQYTYLAAQAFDYETGLLHTEEGRAFRDRAISVRALGVVSDGEPQFAGSNTGDPGLSSILAEMAADWSVLKGRLGVNNPDNYGTTASLRSEKFRILPNADGDVAWRDMLEASRVADLREDADLKTLAMQLDNGDGLPVPGLVVEFSTVIADGYNLFGRRLAPGDHNFSSSSFATKLYAAGVALEGYQGMDNPTVNGATVGGSPSEPDLSFLDPNALAATPYVYLIPVGVDSMRSPPLGDQSVIRSWKVDDVTIPLPFNIGASEHSSKQLFQSSDSLSEPLFGIRKHQAFRPVSTAAVFNHGLLGGLASTEYTSSRLIGRSVWNSKWKLVVPGRNLLSDPDEGLDRFIRTVKDIKLRFETYSYAGN